MEHIEVGGIRIWFQSRRAGIGLGPNGHRQGMTGPIGYWPVEDIKKKLQQLVDAGGQIQQDVKDVGGGKLIAWVKDGHGNLIGLMQSP